MISNSKILLLLLLTLFFACGCGKHDTTARDQEELKHVPDFIDYNNACEAQDFPKALQAAQGLILIYPNNGSAWNAVGYAQEHINNNFIEARKAYAKAVEVNPKHAKAWFNLGVCHGKNHAPLYEIQCYKRAVELRPQYAKAWYNLSLAYELMGEQENSVAAYEKAMAIDPEYVKEQIAYAENLNATLEKEKSISVPPPAINKPELAPQFQKSSPPPQPKKKAKPVSIQNSFFPWNDAPWAKKQTDKLPVLFPDPLQLNVTLPPSEMGAEKKNPAANLEMIRLSNLGLASEKSGDLAAAAQSYRQALQLDKKNASLWNNLGIVQFTMKSYKEAIASFEESARLVEPKTIPWQNIALVFYAQGSSQLANRQDSLAMESLTKALEYNPELDEARRALISILQRNQQWKDVLAQYELFVKQTPLSESAWFGIGIAQMKLGQTSSAVEAFAKATRLNPNIPEIWHWYGTALALGQQYKEAAPAFERCVRLDPKNGPAWYSLGLAQAQLKNWNGSIQSLKSAQKLLPDNIQLQELLLNVYFAAGQFQDAIDLGRNLAVKIKDPSNVWKTICSSWINLNDTEKAMEACKRAIAFAPMDGEAHGQLGQLLAEKSDLEEARKTLLKAIELNYHPPEIWNSLGVVNAKLQKYDEALDNFAEAAKVLKNDPDILMNIGMVFHHMKKESEVQRIVNLLNKTDPIKAAALVEFHTRKEK